MLDNKVDFQNTLFIGHFDDGKEKHQSHEMRILGNRIDKYIDIDRNVWLSSYDIGDIHVYGETEDECKRNIILAIDEVINKLKEFQENVHNNNIPVVNITFDGGIKK